MTNIRWIPDQEYFQLYGSAIFPVSFENVENDYEAPGTRVCDLLSELWERESWVRNAESAILETKFELWPIQDDAGHFRLWLRRVDKGDDFTDYWGFGWVNLDESTGPRRGTDDQQYIQSLARFIWSVDSPVVCQAAVLLSSSTRKPTYELDSIIVTLPTPEMWAEPILPEPHGYPLGSASKTILYDAESPRVALHSDEMMPTSLALFDSEKAMAFVRENCTESEVFVELSLMPEPDNEYDPQAIAVELSASPSNIRIGYLYQRYRGPLLGGLFSDLIQYSPEGIKCLGIIDRGAGESQKIILTLPERELLENDIVDFLRKTPVPPHIGTGLTPIVRRVDQFRAEALELMAHFKDASNHGAVRFRTREVGADGVRMISVRDRASGREIGVINQGFLTLNDERRRDAVILQAMEEGIEFNYGAEEFDAKVSSNFRISEDFVPNIRARMYDNYVAFDTVEKSSTGDRLLLAEYNWRTQVMWVQDDAIAQSVCRFAARLGISVRYLETPPTPWWLQEQIHYTLRRDHTPRGACQARFQWKAPTLPRKPKSAETDDEFQIREKLVEERRILFPRLKYTSEVSSCRICGTRTLAFTVPFIQQRLAYCQSCVIAAHNGRYRSDKSEVLRIAAELFEIENFGQPMLTLQLRSINLLGRTDIVKHEIDRMVRLRQEFRYQDWPWNKLLVEAGLLEAVRTFRGTRVYAVDGHLCLSSYEKIVDDFLHIHDINHEIEPHYPYDPEFNPNSAKRADWRLDDGTLVEMWGLEGDFQYERKKQEKFVLAERYGLELVSISPLDLVRLPGLFAAWIPTTNDSLS